MDDTEDEQTMIDREYKLLREQVTIPYIPSLEKLPKFCESLDKVYTLVLDLDETLIHFEIDEDIDPNEEEPGYYLIRPGAMNFLSELSQYYEIVIFTAAMPDVSKISLTIYFLVCRLDTEQHRSLEQHNPSSLSLAYDAPRGLCHQRFGQSGQKFILDNNHRQPLREFQHDNTLERNLGGILVR